MACTGSRRGQRGEPEFYSSAGRIGRPSLREGQYFGPQVLPIKPSLPSMRRPRQPLRCLLRHGRFFVSTLSTWQSASPAKLSRRG